MEPKQLREMIEDILSFLHPEIPNSESGIELLCLTAAVESDCGRILWRSDGRPGRGIFMMPYDVEQALWVHFVRWHGCRGKLQSLRGENSERWGIPDMIYNIGYQIGMAHTYYHQDAFTFPLVPVPEVLADIWARYYVPCIPKPDTKIAVKMYNKYFG